MQAIFTLFLSCCFLLTYAQADSLRYIVKHYSTDNGLSQNSVKGIAKDDAGFIWLATEAGLTRFDGQTFKNFDQQALNSKSSRIAFMYFNDKREQLLAVSGLEELISIRNGKPALYSKDRWKKIVPPNGDSRYTVGLPTHKNSSFDNYELVVRNGSAFVSRNDSVFFYNQSHSLVFARRFAHTPVLNFFLLNDDLYHLDDHGQLRWIDQQGDIHLCTFKGDLPPGKLQYVNLYWNLTSGDTFLYSDKKLYKLTRQRNYIQAQLILTGFDLLANHIVSIYYDVSQQSIFLGSATQGFYTFKPRHFYGAVAGRELQQSIFYALLPYGDRVLSSQGYLFNNGRKEAFLPLLASHTIKRYSLTQDSRGHIWTTAGIHLFELDNAGSKLLNKVKTTKPINRIALSSDGKHLWLGAYDGTLFTFDINKSKLQCIHNFRKEITWLAPSKDKQLWVGTIQGLYKMDPKNKQLIHFKVLDSYYVRSLYEDETGQLWICTEQRGPLLLKGNYFYSLPLDEKGYLKTAHCILEDRNGYFWISTNNGLFRVYKNTLLSYVAENKAPVYTYYSKEQGFLTNEFNGGCQPCGIKLADGDFAFPSMQGIVQYNPSRVSAPNTGSSLIFDEISIDGKLIEARDSITVPRNFSQLKIIIKTPYFGHPNNLHLAYRLITENKEQPWLNFEHGTITLNKLSSGSHKILVRKIVGEQAISYKTIQLIIQVTPAFYERWWFKLGSIVFSALIIWSLFKIRLQNLKKKNSHLRDQVAEQTINLKEHIKKLEVSQEQLAQETYLHKRLSAAISHDVKNPMRFIVLTLKRVEQLLQAEQHSLTSAVQRIRTSASEIYEYTLMLTDYSKTLLTGIQVAPCQIAIYQLVEQKISIFHEIAEQKGVRIVNEIPVDQTIVNHQELLSIIFHNLIDNAVKFTLEGTILIQSNVMGSRITLMIKDSGMGMNDVQVMNINNYSSDTENHASQEISTQGLGLRITKDLVSIMEGNMHVSSAPKIGTVIAIELPIAIETKKRVTDEQQKIIS